jgi:hypothetical protein
VLRRTPLGVLRFSSFPTLRTNDRRASRHNPTNIFISLDFCLTRTARTSVGAGSQRHKKRPGWGQAGARSLGSRVQVSTVGPIACAARQRGDARHTLHRLESETAPHRSGRCGAAKPSPVVSERTQRARQEARRILHHASRYRADHGDGQAVSEGIAICSAPFAARLLRKRGDVRVEAHCGLGRGYLSKSGTCHCPTSLASN